jgi:hypothetical protein
MGSVGSAGAAGIAWAAGQSRAVSATEAERDLRGPGAPWR